jgi:hypothetical protein
MITLKRLSQYISDPSEFLRQLRSLEDNVADVVKKIDGAFLPNFTVTRRDASSRVNVGEFCVANNVAAHMTITLPAPTPQNAGRCSAVMFVSGSYTCTVTVVEGTVAGSTSDLLGTAGRVYIYVSDGTNWGRTG